MSAAKAPRKQTRRSVSLSETTYNKLASYCKKSKISMSGFVEARIAEFFGATFGAGTKSGRWPSDKPNKANEPKAEPKPKLSDAEQRAAEKVFTF